MNKIIKKRIILSLIIGLVGMITTVLIIFFSTNIIHKGIIRMMCKDEPSSVPENYEEILAITTLREVNYIEGLKLDIIEPLSIEEDALCVVYFHGGYYVGGGRHNQEPFARMIASFGYRVLNVDYDLAPEKIYPTQIRQANMALNFAAEQFPKSKGFVLSGDSAGAHLSAQLSAAVYNSGSFSDSLIDATIARERLLGFVGNCGFYQVSTVEETKFLFIGNAMQMLLGKRNYKQSDLIKEMDLYNYVSSFPSSLLLCGDKDPFILQNKKFFKLLIENGVHAESYFPFSVKNDLGHEFQCNFKLEESQIAMAKIIEFLGSLS